jgi:hypothetical protein
MPKYTVEVHRTVTVIDGLKDHDGEGRFNISHLIGEGLCRFVSRLRVS